MSVEGLLRELAPQVLGVLVRRHRGLDACEDAVQEALIAAAAQWPAEGLPDNPRAWLITVATRRLSDEARSEQARRAREDADAAASRPEDRVAPAAGEAPAEEQDDTLALLFMCCHPALSTPSQIALTLRAIGGLTTAQIAAAFLVPEATMAQRISRGKAAIRAAGTTFALPAGAGADQPAARRPARALPDLQRGLHGDGGRRAAAARARRRGDPADPHGP